MKFSDLLNWHKKTMEEEKEDYKAVKSFQEEKKKLKLILMFTGVAFLIYGSIFSIRWFNSVPPTEYGSSFLTGMATAPLSVGRIGEIRTIGLLGTIILISGTFLLGLGITMPSKSFKDLLRFK